MNKPNKNLQYPEHEGNSVIAVEQVSRDYLNSWRECFWLVF